MIVVAGAFPHGGLVELFYGAIARWGKLCWVAYQHVGTLVTLADILVC